MTQTSCITVTLLSILGLTACGGSHDQTITINAFPVRSAVQATGSQALLKVAQTTCLQNSIYLIVRDSDTGEALSSAQVMLKTVYPAPTALYSDPNTDGTRVAQMLADVNKAFTDKPITLSIPTSRSVEVGIYGNFTDPLDADSDGICDQMTAAAAALNSSSLIGHLPVTADVIKAGTLNLPISILDANPTNGNYTAALQNQTIASHRDFVELNASVQITGSANFQAGSDHSCAIQAGALLCWGLNSLGQLGNGGTSTSLIPVSILAAGVTSVGANAFGTCAVQSGAVLCWGNNNSGQIGNNTTTNASVPTQVTGLTSGATVVAVDNGVACAIVNSGVKCWGYNAVGSLGNGSTTNSSVPVQVSGIVSATTALSVGGGAACAIVAGSLKCWGYNLWGQVGDGTTTNALTPSTLSLTGVTQVSAGFHHTCAVASGAAYCWGNNVYGQIGDGTTTDRSTPTLVTGLLSGVTQIASAVSANGSPVSEHTCAIVNSGVQCWGANTWGQLGNNSTVNSLVPVQVQGLTSGVLSISVSEFHSCAVTLGGLYCWGRNANGGLGNDTNVDSLLPTAAHLLQFVGGTAKLKSVSYGKIKINLDNAAVATAKYYLPALFPYSLSYTYTGTQAAGGCPSGNTSCSASYTQTFLSANDSAIVFNRDASDSTTSAATTVFATSLVKPFTY